MLTCSGVHPVGTDGLLLGAWASVSGVKCILDVGVGTGLVALMLAQRTECARVDGIDASEIARQCAAKNFYASPWAQRLQVVGEDLATYCTRATRQYDLIVSNPPFYAEETVSPNALRRQSRHARFLPVALLADAACQLLTPTGRLCVVMPPLAAQRLAEVGAVRGLYVTRLTEVFSRPTKPAERWLLQLERNPYPFERSKLDIYGFDGLYSPDYRTLTSDFLL
ncbi:MAG: methyltransferase [Saprospiraceae bacterium]|nr:methyltransferase [Saprospiraceae bacterium]